MGDPGGGSDFAGFYNHLGIPIAEWGFGGAGGVYHSQYDSYAWMTKFGDPGFQYHAAAARIAAAMMLRIANADVLPYDYVEYARTMRRYIAPIDEAVADRKWNVTDDRDFARRSIDWSAKPPRSTRRATPCWARLRRRQQLPTRECRAPPRRARADAAGRAEDPAVV